MTDTNLSKFVGLKMPATLNRKLEGIARAECNTVSSVIRRLLVSAIRREERDHGDEAA